MMHLFIVKYGNLGKNRNILMD